MSIKKFFNGALAILLIAALLTSCQKDELDNLPEEITENVENEENPENEVTTTTIFTKSEIEDEDEELCFEVNFPITVVYPDATTQQVADEAELDQIIDDFYENQEAGSEADLAVQFPVSLTLQDGTVITVNSEEEIGEAILEHCIGTWNDYEDDFEMDELCFDINFPISISLDGTTQTINTLEEFENTIETYLQANPDADEDDVEVQYPVDVTLEDGTIVSVNSDDEFEELLEEECFGDFGDFGDFEMGGLCFNINFPISISLGDTTQILNNLEELIFTTILYLESNPDAEEDDVAIQYPIDVTLEDGTVVSVNSNDEFEELLEDECE